MHPVARRTREERLFGAACLCVKLEQSGTAPSASEIYRATLQDLDLTEAEVERFLAEQRPRVETALASGRGRGT